MARAENQGLQIALIVFVMFTIVLAVVTFMYVRSYQEAAALNKKLQEDATKAGNDVRTAQEEINNIKGLLGVDVNMTFENVKKTFDADMAQFAATLPPDKQHYRDALESLWNTNQDVFAAQTDLQNQFKQLQDQMARRETERDQQIKEWRDKAEAQAKDTVEQRAKFDDDRNELNARDEKMVRSLEQKENEKVQLVEQAAKQEGTLKGEIKALASNNEHLSDEVKGYRKSQFEVAQGQVVRVDPSRQAVYLNLGSADRLLPLVTFSVHDAEANTAQGDGLKARIEVQRILGPHLSVARMLEENHVDPIANGDKLFTPLWHPGQQTHFAILGTIDLDGDGEDDRDVIKDLITSVGGVIDAEMDALGKITGNIDYNTRYLLEGKVPQDREAAKGAAEMINRAQRSGTERIPTTRFIELSGWKDPRQVVEFGRNGTRERIPRDKQDGSMSAAQSHMEANFQKRRPWNPKQGDKTEKPASP